MLDVDLREIEVFLTLAEELHFGRTGERLGVTQSRVSQVIRTLETRLGGALFDRTSRRVRLTPLGDQLEDTIRATYDALDAAITGVRRAARGVSGTFRLGMYTPVSGGPHLIEIVKTFEANHPACRVEIADIGFATPQLDWLRNGAVDALATRLPIHDPDLTIGPVLSRDDRALVVAADHPLARRQSVSVEDLADCVVPDPPTVPCETMAALTPATTPSGRPIARRTVHTLSEVVTLVALGKIVHPTVTSFAEYHHHHGITAVPLTGLPPSETALVWLTNHRTAKITAFADAATTVLETHGSA